MYDMYPDDWGPSRAETTYRSEQAVQQSLDLRDHGGRPDDN